MNNEKRFQFGGFCYVYSILNQVLLFDFFSCYTIPTAALDVVRVVVTSPAARPASCLKTDHQPSRSEKDNDTENLAHLTLNSLKSRFLH